MLNDATEGFSPCPEPLVEILKTWVVRSDFRGTLLDNCAGDGSAANALAQAWGLRPVLVEPHAGRHALCLRYDRTAICSPAQHVIGRGPTVWFFNPPYDLDDETGSIERHLLWSAVTRVPGPQTFCVWLMPRRMVQDPFFVRLIDWHFAELRAFALASPWEDYRQIAVMGYWRDQAERSAASVSVRSEVLLTNLPPLDEADRPYRLRPVGVNFRVELEPTRVPGVVHLENYNLRKFAKGAV